MNLHRHILPRFQPLAGKVLPDVVFIHALEFGGHQNGSRTFFSHGLGAVDDKVHNKLLNLAWVGLDRRQVGIEFKPELDQFRNRGSNQATDFADQLREVNFERYKTALAGVSQQLARESGSLFACLEDLLQKDTVRTRYGHGLQSQARVAHDAHQEIVKIVSDSTSQKTQAFELLGLAELLVNIFALGDIDNGTEDPRPTFCADGIQPDLHGKLRAVFSKPVEIPACAHRPGTRVAHELRPVCRMLASILGRYQDIHSPS